MNRKNIHPKLISDSAEIADIQMSDKEQKVIERVRQLDYGEVRIVVQNSEIVLIEEKKTTKL